MKPNMILASSLLAGSAFFNGNGALAVTPGPTPAAMMGTPVAGAEGVIRLRSTHNVADTVDRIKTALAAKGIRFFAAINQAGLAGDAKLALQPSTLVLFGNPPLGVQFLQANRYAGLDWPVRMLVVQEADGGVWLAWTDFNWIKRRYGLKGLDVQIKMATEVAASIAVEAAG